MRDDESNSSFEDGFNNNEDAGPRIRTRAEEDFQNDINAFQNENEMNKYRTISKKKKEKKKKRKTGEENGRSTINRKIVNLPASEPYIRIVDGEERLCFKYNTKVSETALNAMPRSELEENEFCVRFDLDTVDISKISEKFKADNVIYPRANVAKESYTGNRWAYETECNKLAWQFVTLNHVLLYGKKGLIQRAVDSYRTLTNQSKNRKLGREDGLGDGMVKRRHSELAPTSATVTWTLKGITKKCKVRIDIENVNFEKIDDEFKFKYSIFQEDFDENSFGLGTWEAKNSDNMLAVKIAYLNVDNTSFWNAIKATDKTTMLKKAVDAYKNRETLMDSNSSDEAVNVQNMVNDVMSEYKKRDEVEDLFSFEDGGVAQ